jgi:ribose 5-phosphate isomerase A
MTIYERALDFVSDGDVVGLGSGRASMAFIKELGDRVKQGLKVRGVPTSNISEELAHNLNIPLVSLADGMPLALTVDGADEVDPRLNLIKGYGRALVREKIVAAASKKLVILAGTEKLVEKLGRHGKLPVEVVPFALPLCRDRLARMGLNPVPYQEKGRLFTTDNGNHILDCMIGPIDDPARLEEQLLRVPGVVGTGLFLGMASVVLIGDKDKQFALVEEKCAPAAGSVPAQ